MKSLSKIIPVLILLLMTASVSYGAENNVIENIEGVFKNNMVTWKDNIMPFALRIFWMLVFFDFAWTTLKGLLSDADFGDYFREFTKKILFYGIGVLLVSKGDEYTYMIVSYFQNLSNSVQGGATVNASSIFDDAMHVIKSVVNTSSMWDVLNPIATLNKSVTAIIAVLLLCYVSCIILVAYCEIYVVIGFSPILFALIGSSFTQDIPRKFIIHTLAIGVKLFATILIAKLGFSLLNTWITTLKTAEFAELLANLGAIFVFAFLITVIPKTLAGMISGSSLGTGADSFQSTMKRAAQATGAAAVGAATGGVGAVGSAVSLAKAQGASSIGSIAVGATRNLGSAMGSTFKGGITGSYKAPSQQNTGQRMSQSMLAKIDKIKSKSEDSIGAPT